MQAAFRIFSSSVETWEVLFGRAAEFATRIGRERVISISHSQEELRGVVAVWYWQHDQEATTEPGAVEGERREAADPDGIYGPDEADLADAAGEAEEENLK